jgi:dihydrofolate reductase
MRKIISFMHMSLDGFVAGPAGEMDWIKVDEEIFDHVGKRVSGSNTALYGRVTFRMMENYWPGAAARPGATRHDIEHSQWYNRANKVVLSRTLKEEGLTNTEIIGDKIRERINELKGRPGQDILVFGSPGATHSLLRLDLVDGFWLFINPIILGQGIPLFADIKDKIKLRLLSTRAFSCGVTELNYTVERK